MILVKSDPSCILEKASYPTPTQQLVEGGRTCSCAFTQVIIKIELMCHLTYLLMYMYAPLGPECALKLTRN